MERYARQVAFSHLGEGGQRKLLGSKVAIIGMGALGTVSANNLCRSGVGHIRMVDRDYVELTNLQRQILFDEDDARQRLPKVIAASRHLSKINSEITLEPLIADVNASNIEQIVSDAGLVLDATDNWETRLLINEACFEHKIPWIYCGALGSEGMSMNILPGGAGPCLRCFISCAPTAPAQSCSTSGVLNMITGIMASVQTAEALKILTGAGPVREELFVMDVWGNRTTAMKIKKDPSCPVCSSGSYEYLGKVSGAYTTSLCGSDSVQVAPAKPVPIDFGALAEKLGRIGTVSFNKYYLVFSDGKYEIMLFGDGRAMIKNTVDENNAKSVYSEYLGL